MTMTKRQALLRQAIDLFAVQGYQATPTAEIAARAEVAEGTLFHHFGTKEGVLREILIGVFDRYFEQASQRVETADTGLDGLGALLSFHFAFVADNCSEMLVATRDFPYHLLDPDTDGYAELMPRFRRHLGLFVTCLERGIQDGSVREVPVNETAHLLRSLLLGATRLALLGPLKVPDLSGPALDLCHRGLAANPVDVAESA